ncbi:MAG: VanZ family protein [Flavisolibacter sp.]
MNALLKKLLVLLPVLVLGIFYLHDHQDTYEHIRNKRLLLLVLTLLLIYGWIFLDIASRKQRSFFQIFTQASFYVYVFMVLTLTGYFILFREVSAYDWWHRMMIRIERRDHVNLRLFKMFKIYKLFSKQIIGNFIMLFPLGIFLPLLYRQVSTLLPVFLVSLFVSSTIELLQLATSFRSADVDDVFLNTLGACAGFIFFKAIALAWVPDPEDRSVSMLETPMA